MANELVSLEYLFLFYPDEAWDNLREFEKDLSAFFEAYGLEAVIVKGVEGQQGRRILLIRRPKELLDGKDPSNIKKVK